MNIAIGSNNKQAFAAQTAPKTNSMSSALDVLMKQKESLQDEIKTMSQNKALSQSEKTQKLNDLQKQMDELNSQIAQQKLEDMKNSGKEIAENMSKKAEKATTNEEKEENAGAALNYSLISATEDSSHMKKLNGYRKTAVKEEGPNSARVQRIDNMLSDKSASIKENLTTMAKAIEQYSKNNKKDLEEKLKEKADKHENDNVSVENNNNSDTASEQIKTDGETNNDKLKNDSMSINNKSNEKHAIDVNDNEEKLLNEQNKSKKLSNHFVDVCV